MKAPLRQRVISVIVSISLVLGMNPATSYAANIIGGGENQQEAPLEQIVSDNLDNAIDETLQEEAPLVEGVDEAAGEVAPEAVVEATAEEDDALEALEVAPATQPAAEEDDDALEALAENATNAYFDGTNVTTDKTVPAGKEFAIYTNVFDDGGASHVIKLRATDASHIYYRENTSCTVKIGSENRSIPVTIAVDPDDENVIVVTIKNTNCYNGATKIPIYFLGGLTDAGETLEIIEGQSQTEGDYIKVTATTTHFDWASTASASGDFYACNGGSSAAGNTPVTISAKSTFSATSDESAEYNTSVKATQTVTFVGFVMDSSFTASDITVPAGATVTKLNKDSQGRVTGYEVENTVTGDGTTDLKSEMTSLNTSFSTSKMVPLSDQEVQKVTVDATVTADGDPNATNDTSTADLVAKNSANITATVVHGENAEYTDTLFEPGDNNVYTKIAGELYVGSKSSSIFLDIYGPCHNTYAGQTSVSLDPFSATNSDLKAALGAPTLVSCTITADDGTERTVTGELKASGHGYYVNLGKMDAGHYTVSAVTLTTIPDGSIMSTTFRTGYRFSTNTTYYTSTTTTGLLAKADTTYYYTGEDPDISGITLKKTGSADQVGNITYTLVTENASSSAHFVSIVEKWPSSLILDSISMEPGKNYTARFTYQDGTSSGITFNTKGEVSSGTFPSAATQKDNPITQIRFYTINVAANSKATLTLKGHVRDGSSFLIDVNNQATIGTQSSSYVVYLAADLTKTAYSEIDEETGDPVNPYSDEHMARRGGTVYYLIDLKDSSSYENPYYKIVDTLPEGVTAQKLSYRGGTSGAFTQVDFTVDEDGILSSSSSQLIKANQTGQWLLECTISDEIAFGRFTNSVIANVYEKDTDPTKETYLGNTPAATADVTVVGDNSATLRVNKTATAVYSDLGLTEGTTGYNVNRTGDRTYYNAGKVWLNGTKKDIDLPGATPGSYLMYRISLSASADSDTDAVVYSIEDTIPAGCTFVGIQSYYFAGKFLSRSNAGVFDQKIDDGYNTGFIVSEGNVAQVYQGLNPQASQTADKRLGYVKPTVSGNVLTLTFSNDSDFANADQGMTVAKGANAGYIAVWVKVSDDASVVGSWVNEDNRTITNSITKVNAPDWVTLNDSSILDSSVQVLDYRPSISKKLTAVRSESGQLLEKSSGIHVVEAKDWLRYEITVTRNGADYNYFTGLNVEDYIPEGYTLVTNADAEGYAPSVYFSGSKQTLTNPDYTYVAESNTVTVNLAHDNDKAEEYLEAQRKANGKTIKVTLWLKPASESGVSSTISTNTAKAIFDNHYLTAMDDCQSDWDEKSVSASWTTYALGGAGIAIEKGQTINGTEYRDNGYHVIEAGEEFEYTLDITPEFSDEYWLDAGDGGDATITITDTLPAIKDGRDVSTFKVSYGTGDPVVTYRGQVLSTDYYRWSITRGATNEDSDVLVVTLNKAFGDMFKDDTSEGDPLIQVKFPVVAEEDVYGVKATNDFSISYVAKSKGGSLPLDITSNEVSVRIPGCSASLTVEKAIAEGAQAGEDETFTFEITPQNEDNPMPKVATASCAADATATFQAITYTEEGTYVYTISEVLGDNSAWKASGDITATVVVSTNNAGDLVATVTYSPESDTITNEPAYGSLTIEKTIEGLPDAPENLQFTITGPSYPNGKTVNYSDFTNGVYTEENLLPGSYAVTEKNAVVPGYDLTTTYKVDSTETTAESVTVDGKPATQVALTVEAGKNVKLDVLNDYGDGSTSLSFKGTKFLDGQASTVEFKFAATAEDDSVDVPSAPSSNDSNGEFALEDITFNAAGEFTLTVAEVEDNYGSYTLDDTEYEIVVKVSATDSGALTIESVKYQDESLENEGSIYALPKTDGASFNNTSLLGSLKISKVFRDGDGADLTGALLEEAMMAVQFTITGPSFPQGKTVTYTNDFKDGVYTEEDLIPGEYTVEETASDISSIPNNPRYKVGDGEWQSGNSALVSVQGDEEVAVEWVNEYVVGSATLTISGTKALTGSALSANQFSFKVAQDSSDSYQVTRPDNATNDGQGNFAFGAITFKFPGVYNFTVSEVKLADKTIIYDLNTSYEVKVEVEAQDGFLMVTKINGENIDPTSEATYQLPAAQGKDASFNNDTVKGQLTIKKTVEGDITAEEAADKLSKLTFTVTGPSYPDGLTVAYSQFTDGSYDVGQVYPGTYTVTETNARPDGYTLTTTYKVNGSAAEKAEAQVASNGSASIELINTYVKGSATLTISGTKALTGSALSANQFSFQVAQDGGDAVQLAGMPASASNDGQGGIAFGAITFKEPGTYNFTVSEVAGTDASIIYDGTTYPVSVTVEAQGTDVLVTEINGAAVTATSAATYQLPAAQGKDASFNNDTVKGQLTIKKTIEGELSAADEAALKEALTFTVTGPSYPDGLTVAYGQFTDGSYDVGQVYPGTYTVTEANAKVEGYTLTTTYKVNGSEADAAQAQVASSGSATIELVNTYPACEVKAAVAGTKALIDGSLADFGPFSFQLAQGGSDAVKVLSAAATAESDEKGDFSFAEMTFKYAGSYTFTATEVAGDDDRIAYDTATSYAITVTVTAGDDCLTITGVEGATYDAATGVILLPAAQGKDASFNNQVKHGKLTLTKSLIDELTGSALTADPNPDLSFTVKGPSFPNGAALTYIDNFVDGSYTFEDIIVGEYTVTETDADIEGYTLTATFMVGEEETNKITVVPSDITPEGVTLSVENSYLPGTTTLGVTATKELLYGTLAPSQFSFMLSQTDGPVTILSQGVEKANAEDGTIDFGTLTFHYVGTYTFQVQEIMPELVDETITYDEEAIIFNVTVVADGNNVVIESVKVGDDELTVENGIVAMPAKTVETAEASFVNQVKPGNLTITKTFASTDESYSEDLASMGNPTFTVTGPSFPEGTTVTYADDFTDGSYTFENIIVGQYTVVETNANINGYTLTSTVYTVGEEETSEATVEATKTTTMAVTNTYTPCEVKATLAGTKALIDGNLEDFDNFTFQITQATTEGAPVAIMPEDISAESDAATGAFAFDEITFKYAGTYTFIVKEVVPEETDPWIVYDADTEYTITVTVEAGEDCLTIADVQGATYDQEQGIIALPSAEGTEASFNNEMARANLVINKTLVDTNLEAELTAEPNSEMSFTVTGPSFPEGTTVLYADFIDGSYTFENIIAGIYTVVEENADVEGYTLTTTYTVGEDETSEITVQPNGDELDCVMDIQNAYTPGEVTLKVQGTKAVTADKLVAGAYNFGIEFHVGSYDVTMPASHMATNDAKGVFTFGDIAFNYAGSYTFFVFELAGGDATIDYDTQVYTVVVTIAAEGEGLVVKSVTVTGEYAAPKNVKPGEITDCAIHPVVDNVIVPVTDGVAVLPTYELNGQTATFVNVVYGAVTISGTKTWVDYDNGDNTRPADLTLTVQAKAGTSVVDVKLQTTDAAASNYLVWNKTAGANTWTYTITNLNKYDAQGNELVYTVTEVVPAKYVNETATVEVKFTNDKGTADFTNTYTREEKQLPKTGDDTNVTPIAALAAMSLVGMIVPTIIRRREEAEEK